MGEKFMTLGLTGKIGRGGSLEMRAMAFRLNYKKECQGHDITKSKDLEKIK